MALALWATLLLVVAFPFAIKPIVRTFERQSPLVLPRDDRAAGEWVLAEAGRAAASGAPLGGEFELRFDEPSRAGVEADVAPWTTGVIAWGSRAARFVLEQRAEPMTWAVFDADGARVAGLGGVGLRSHNNALRGMDVLTVYAERPVHGRDPVAPGRGGRAVLDSWTYVRR